jgi:spermidine synthase
VLGLGLAVVVASAHAANLKSSLLIFGVAFLPAVLFCFSFASRPLRFALGFGALLLASTLYTGQYGRVLATERSFFGVYRVSEAGEYRQLFHGTTLHGIQSMDPSRTREPLSYYYETGPIGQVFRSPSVSGHLHHVAVVGLGAGSLACYSAPSRDFTFYEIDPTVERIARNPHYFTFLRDCSPGTAVVIGDARISLRKPTALQYDLVIVDAFSSDSIPVHLVTREAIRLYLARLADHGLLAFNISNRYLDLRPVLGALAQDVGLACKVQKDERIDEQEERRGKYASTWVLMARQSSDFGTLASQPNWGDIQVGSGDRLWTDDYSSIAGLIHLH